MLSGSEPNIDGSMAHFDAPQQNIGRDFITFGIAIAAIILFVGTAGQVLSQSVRNVLYGEARPDQLLVNAVILNIALIIMVWRRYKELRKEIDERRNAELTARQLAETDPLTGSLNRRSLAGSGARLMQEAARDHRAVAALMMDIDHFKAINDLNGHRVGDEVLIELANRIRDTMPQDALVARLGGDEFAMLVRFDARSPETVDRYAEDLLRAIKKPFLVDGLELEISSSIGMACTDGEHESELTESFAQTLVHRADIAMYQAKKAGRGQSIWFEPLMENELRFRNELEVGIRKGVREGHFLPYYERQIDLATGKLNGFEMLARWESPELGVIGPDLFIPIAEEMGIIGEMSDRLIELALADASRWNPALTLSVNISPLQLRDPWFAQKLLQRLHAAQFPPQRLEIEITESCLHENMENVQSVVTSLKNQGVKITLDDFGTGFSSLAQLRSLPFDRIKIDRSFVRGLGADGDSGRIVEYIVQLSKGLDLPVTAEGIENEDILAELQSLGDMKGQGYHYGRPENAQDTYEWLLTQDLVMAASQNAPLSADQAAKVANSEPALRTA